MEHPFYGPKTPPSLPTPGYLTPNQSQPPATSRRRRPRSSGAVPSRPLPPAPPVGFLASPPAAPQRIQKPPAPRRVKKSPRKLPSGRPSDSALNGVVKKWTIDLLSFTALLGASALMVGGAWISYQLIVHPDATTVLNRFLPEWVALPVEKSPSLQTLEQIETSLRELGLTPGTPIPLPSASNANESLASQRSPNESDILLPIMIERPANAALGCETTCQQIVELRTYQYADIPGRSKTAYFRLVGQIPIDGPADSFVIASAVDAQEAISNKPLPVTSLTTFTDGPAGSGVWFNLKGKRVQGNQSIPYGYILHYNPTHLHLSIMLEWRSLAGKLPKWQNITGTEDPELVLDQTQGLEPQFDIYQLQSRKFVPDPIELVAISVDEPWLKHQAYKEALRLASSGLWSPALTRMQPLSGKESRLFVAGWLPEAQAQLDVIAFHAKITQAQATRDWASPAQKALVDIIDGRWKAALDLFESDLQNSYAISQLLKTDTGQIWKRVETTLKVQPQHLEAKAWGALLIAVQEDRNAAVSWLNGQPETDETSRNRILEILARLDNSVTDAEILKQHRSQIIGSVSTVSQLNPKQWHQPPEATAALKPSSYQVWFQINVASFHDGYQWRQPPFQCTGTPTPNCPLSQLSQSQTQHLWRRLGLHNDSQIQIDVWTAGGQRQTTTATIQALTVEGGSLRLLALGNEISGVPITQNMPQPLAFTASALQWLQPQTLTIASLNAERPEWVANILPILWQELQAAGQLPSGVTPNSEEMLTRLGNWFVQIADLTGNNQPEALFMLQTEATSTTALPSTWPRTLIFSDTGTLIYSEFTQEPQQFVTGLVDMKDGGPAALIVDAGDTQRNYSLQRWSGEQQRFAQVGDQSPRVSF